MPNPNKVGLVIGAVIGGWHLVWSLLVLLGWAQRIIDFIFWAHMIQPIYVIKRFDITAALTLIVITAIIGYIFGYIGAIRSSGTNCTACNCASTSLTTRPGQTA